MPPELKNKLVFTLLLGYYKKFFFFFNDVIEQNFADLVFVRKILSRLDCIIYIDGNTIVESGKVFHNLYFVWKGAVTIVDSEYNFQIAKLSEESFFGDFQLLLNTLSEFNFIATNKLIPNQTENERVTWCMTLAAKEFHEICEQFPATRAFMTVRAI